MNTIDQEHRGFDQRAGKDVRRLETYPEVPETWWPAKTALTGRIHFDVSATYPACPNLRRCCYAVVKLLDDISWEDVTVPTSLHAGLVPQMMEEILNLCRSWNHGVDSPCFTMSPVALDGAPSLVRQVASTGRSQSHGKRNCWKVFFLVASHTYQDRW